jgi:hypothetical protein
MTHDFPRGRGLTIALAPLAELDGPALRTRRREKFLSIGHEAMV